MKGKNSNNQNGKGDSPRNNTTRKFRDNYNKINWKKKIDKTKKKQYTLHEIKISTMDQITELWNLPWGDGLLLTFMLMALYTYKVWIDNKFKK